MRAGREGAFHLTYCTNIHPGESWDEVFSNLETHLPGLKAALSPDDAFGVGLRLSDRASRALLEGNRLPRFRAWLDARDLYVFTINGFPYGGFHRQVVKDRVYMPDWRTQERVDYTVRLAHILAALLPDGLDGGISTSPIAYKHWFDGGAYREAFEEGARRLADVTAALVRIRERTGRYVHVDIEPEPDCLLETTEETVAFFRDVLLPVGGEHLAAMLGGSLEVAQEHLLAHVNVCYDTCHLAVEYEQPASVVERLRAAGIRIGKVQLSSALKAGLPADPGGRTRLRERLASFAESTYLHQVVERPANGELVHYPDLPQALARDDEHGGPDAGEWRIHFHVPVFVGDFSGLSSTQEDLAAALELLAADPFCRHLEIETYTWEVLPPRLKVDVGTSIRREYAWVLDRIGRAQG